MLPLGEILPFWPPYPKLPQCKIFDTQMWVLEIVDINFCPAKRYIKIASNRSADNFLSIIERVCKLCTESCSGEWVPTES